jgi:hypothetical protein
VSIKALWQEQFDTEYPSGLVMSWLHDDDADTGDGAHYLVPRALVLDTDGGFDPVVRLDVYGPDKSFVFTVIDYLVYMLSPTGAVVTGRGMHDRMVWSADVPADEAQHMQTWYLTHSTGHIDS